MKRWMLDDEVFKIGFWLISAVVCRYCVRFLHITGLDTNLYSNDRKPHETNEFKNLNRTLRENNKNATRVKVDGSLWTDWVTESNKNACGKTTNQIFKFMHNISIRFRIHIPDRLFWCGEKFLLVGYVCLLDHYCCQVFSSQQWTQIFSSQPEWDCVKAPNHRCFRCLPPVRAFQTLWTQIEDETTQVQSKTIAIIAQIGDFFVICWFERKKNSLLVAAVHTHIIQLVQ